MPDKKEPKLLRVFGGVKSGQRLLYSYEFSGCIRIPMKPKMSAVRWVNDNGTKPPTFVAPDILTYYFRWWSIYGTIYEYLVDENTDNKTVVSLLFSLYNIFNWMSNPGRSQITTFEEYLLSLPPEFPNHY